MISYIFNQITRANKNREREKGSNVVSKLSLRNVKKLWIQFYFHTENYIQFTERLHLKKMLSFRLKSTKERNFKVKDQTSNIWSQFDTVG